LMQSEYPRYHSSPRYHSMTNGKATLASGAADTVTAVAVAKHIRLLARCSGIGRASCIRHSQGGSSVAGGSEASWCCYSLQSARLVLLCDMVVRPVLLLMLQDTCALPMLSVGRLALGSPPGQKLAAAQGWQLRVVPLRNCAVPGGHTAGRNRAAAAAGHVSGNPAGVGCIVAVASFVL
jgi:hypothetical protein